MYYRLAASRRRPHTQLVINLDTLGRSELTMPGDDAGMEMEAITGVQVPRQPHRNSTPQLGNDSDTLHQDDSTPILLDPDHAGGTQVTDTHTTPRRRRMGKKARSSNNNKLKRAETVAHYRTQDPY